VTRGSDQDTEREIEGDLIGGQRWEVKTVGGETKEADKVRDVRGVKGKSVVGEGLKGIGVGKARGLRRWGQRWLRRGKG
jgi:hypothetical protein